MTKGRLEMKGREEEEEWEVKGKRKTKLRKKQINLEVSKRGRGMLLQRGKERQERKGKIIGARSGM